MENLAVITLRAPLVHLLFGLLSLQNNAEVFLEVTVFTLNKVVD